MVSNISSIRDELVFSYSHTFALEGAHHVYIDCWLSSRVQEQKLKISGKPLFNVKSLVPDINVARKC